MAGDRQVASQMQGRTISSRGLTAVGVFLFFGATMACLAGTTLTWPGTILDRAWRVNPAAYEQLAGYGRILGVAFFALSAVLTLAGIGWFQRRRWGWLLAVAIIATQLLGDGVNVIRGDFLRGIFGMTVAAALLFYLLRRQVRRSFASDLP